MTTEEYLISKGWKLVRNVVRYPANWQAWDHPEHQDSRRGFFKKTEALAHQKRLDKGYTCMCVKER